MMVFVGRAVGDGGGNHFWGARAKLRWGAHHVQLYS